MNKIVLPFAFLGLLLGGCVSREEAVRAVIEEGNYCSTPEDCEFVGSKCPFDCYIYANVNAADRVRQAVESYASTCVYSCIASRGVTCEQGKCKALTDDPSAYEGNRGAPCAAHEECQTPGSFLIRSVCPYGSMCIEGRCEVVCPIAAPDPDPRVSRSVPVTCTQDADCDCSSYIPGNLGRCACIDATCVAVVEEERRVMTEQEAIDVIRERPEVRQFERTLNEAGKSAEFDATEESGIWTVQVFEIVTDGETTHTATFNWYTIDRETGAVTQEFPAGETGVN